MDDARAILLILYTITGALLILLSIPLIRGRVGPNRWYGFRVEATLEDPAIWYPVNAYAAWRMLGLGVALMLAAAAPAFVRDFHFVAYALSCAAILVGGWILILVQTRRYLRKLVGRDIGRQL